jgi:hypothetical protein
VDGRGRKWLRCGPLLTPPPRPPRQAEDERRAPHVAPQVRAQMLSLLCRRLRSRRARARAAHRRDARAWAEARGMQDALLHEAAAARRPRGGPEDKSAGGETGPPLDDIMHGLLPRASPPRPPPPHALLPADEMQV